MKSINCLRMVTNNILGPYSRRRHFLTQYRYFQAASMYLTLNSKLFANTSYSFYCQFTAKPCTPIENKHVKSTTELLQCFSEVAKSKDFTEIIIHPVLAECTTHFAEFTVEEVFKIVDCLSCIKTKFPDLYHYDDHIAGLAAEVDAVFCELMKVVNEEQIFKLITLSSVLIRHRSKFPICVIKQMKKILRLPTNRLLEAFTHINRENWWRFYYVDKYSIECSILRHWPLLTVNEMAVLLHPVSELGIFLSNPELPKKIFDMFVTQLPDASPETVNTFLKFFLHHVRTFHTGENMDRKVVLPLMVKLFNENVNSWPLPSATIAAYFLTKTYCYSEEFFKKFINKLISDEVLNLKVNLLNQAVSALAYFGFSSSIRDVYPLLLSRLKTEPMYTVLRNHPKKLVTILESLSKIGVYDYDLLSIVLSMEFLKDTYRKLDRHCIPVQYYCLDINVGMECPDYQGPRLNDDLREAFGKMWNQRLPKLLESESNTSKIRNTNYAVFTRQLKPIMTEILGGNEYLHVCFLHPHLPLFHLIFALLDQVPQKLHVIQDKTQINRDMLDQKFTWYALATQKRNTIPPHEPLFSFHGVNSARYVSKMGIKLIPIILPDWHCMSDEAKKNYLKNLIPVTNR